MSGRPNISHGRGGAANIGPDANTYADGEIVREGAVGDQGDGKYSSGRGGAANIVGQETLSSGASHDADVVLETATKIDKHESHHIGRGGAGNETHVHKDKSGQQGLDHKGGSIIDKAKSALGMGKTH